MRRTKWLFRLGLAGKRPWTGVPKDLAAQVHLSLTLKEAVPKHDLYSHPMFSTLRSLPFRPADWSLASPFLNPITYASFEMVAPEMGPFFLGRRRDQKASGVFVGAEVASLAGLSFIPVQLPSTRAGLSRHVPSGLGFLRQKRQRLMPTFSCLSVFTAQAMRGVL